jgi:hypothetical protein
MKNIFDAIREKEAEVARHTRELEILRQAAQLLAEKDDATAGKSNDTVTQLEMARAVLLEAGKPSHIDAIVTAIDTKYHKKIERRGLEPTIYKHIKQAKTKVFRQEEGPHMFGLLEWSLNQNHRAEHPAA